MSISRRLIFALLPALFLAPLAAQSQPDNTPHDSRAQTPLIFVTPMTAPSGIQSHFDPSHPCSGPVICDSFGASSPLASVTALPFEAWPQQNGSAIHQLAPFVSPIPNGIHIITLAQNTAPCYTLRSYEFSPTDPKSGATKLTGVSTCQPASKIHFKSAIQPVAR